MPRKPRLDLAGVPQHIIQRGNDRQPRFFTQADYHCHLAHLREISLREDCRVHAYVLMANQVHLLATPVAAGQIARLMQVLGRRYVRYVNDRHHRTGTLWEGRYEACMVDSERYLLSCYRTIELNPVRARMVTAPDDYAWSSFGSNGMGKTDPLVRPHRRTSRWIEARISVAASTAIGSCSRSTRKKPTPYVSICNVNMPTDQTASETRSKRNWVGARDLRRSDGPESSISLWKVQPHPLFLDDRPIDAARAQSPSNPSPKR